MRVAGATKKHQRITDHTHPQPHTEIDKHKHKQRERRVLSEFQPQHPQPTRAPFYKVFVAVLDHGDAQHKDQRHDAGGRVQWADDWDDGDDHDQQEIDLASSTRQRMVMSEDKKKI